MTHILLLHASVGMGHWRAATALEGAFRTVEGTSTRVEDTLHHARTIFRRGYAGSYLQIADHVPAFWSRFYAYTDRPFGRLSLVGGVRTISTKFGVHGLPTLLDDARPDAIVCTHFLPLEVLGPLRQAGLIPPLYCVVTDYRAHHFWACEGVDRYFVPTPQTAHEMMQAGIPRSQIEVTGIPIDLSVRRPVDTISVRRELGLPDSGAIVLLNGSGLAVERVGAIVDALIAEGVPATIAVATGRNRMLAAALAGVQGTAQTQIRVLGQLPGLDGLIAASALVIGKSGGLTVSEVLGRGVPLIVPTPVPGQEQWNADYITQCGAGLCRDTARGVARAAGHLLRNDYERDAMARAARALGRPAAAEAIAASVMNDVPRTARPWWGPTWAPDRRQWAM